MRVENGESACLAVRKLILTFGEFPRSISIDGIVDHGQPKGLACSSNLNGSKLKQRAHLIGKFDDTPVITYNTQDTPKIEGK